MATMLDDFKGFLDDFKGVGAWALSAAIALPVLAALAGVAPPWPRGAATLTALLEIVTLILIYHWVSRLSRAGLSSLFRRLAPVMALFLVAYLVLFSMFVFTLPTNGEPVVKGFACTPNAAALAERFGDACPFLGRDALAAATYEVDRLWTIASITLVRLALFVTWLGFFLSFVAFVAAFVVHARKRRAASPAPRQAP